MQKAITWNGDDAILQRHVASLGRSGFTSIKQIKMPVH